MEHIWFVQKKNLETLLPTALEKAVRVYREDTANQIYTFFSDRAQVSLKMDEIIKIIRDNRRILIITAKKQYPSIDSLSTVMKKTSGTSLIRISGYCVANIHHITRLTAKDVVLDDGSQERISPLYLPALRSAYQNWWDKRL